nr:protein SIEVE ELEMENT OCCLUSION B-like [Ipomoea batatas]
MAISHINESDILEEVMSTHDPNDKENFKINVIFDLVKSILYPTTIGDSIDEDGDSDKEDSNGQKSDEDGDKSDEEYIKCDKSDEEEYQNGRMVHRNAMHMVLMRGLDICGRMSDLKVLSKRRMADMQMVSKRKMSVGVEIGDIIIPFLQKVLTERVSTMRDLVPGIDGNISEFANKVDGLITNWFSDIQKQMQNLVDSNIFTSKKENDLWKIETWCTKLVLGNLVEENRCIFLIGGHDIQWVKTFESKVMLEIQCNPQSQIKMFYVGSNMKVASMIEVDGNCNVKGNLFSSWLFWSRLQSIFMSRINFVEETHGDEEYDEILEKLKKLLAYEANDLVVKEWAMLCKGNKIVVCDQGDKMLKVMNEYEKWKENAIAKGFDQAFKDYHDMLDSTSTSLYHHQCALKYPCNFDHVLENANISLFGFSLRQIMWLLIRIGSIFQ